MAIYSEIAAAIEAAGLSPRGALLLEEGEFAGGRALVLIGMVGARDWPAFAGSPEFADGAPDPLDRWSRRLIDTLANGLGATAVYPFGGPPYLPFQRWAQRAETLFPSPLGLLIHPKWGLWHSFRGALAFAEALDLLPRQTAKSPCETCTDRPCLSACPVGAFSPSGYEVDACVGYLRNAGRDCVDRGCLARRACPVGREFAQQEGQAGFYMRAFLRSRPISSAERAGLIHDELPIVTPSPGSFTNS